MLSAKGFDLWADGYDKSVGLSDEDNSYPFAGYREVLNRIYNEILAYDTPEILDLGFGTGALTSRLYEQGCSVYGMDFSQRMIELAQEKMPDAVLVQGDFAQGLPEALCSRCYDAIAATYSLHHLTDEQKVDFIRSLLPLLKDGGKLLIGDVAFPTRAQLEQCRTDCGEEWDDEEIYFVFEEIEAHFPGKVRYEQISYCAGILTFTL